MTPADASVECHRICCLAPVIPVLEIENVSTATELAKALIAGGLPVLEVTLRTPVALDAIAAMADVAGGVVGAGTLLTATDVKSAKDAGATFGVSPGATDELLLACEDADLPLLPGAATASEIMRLLQRGYGMQKFFPAGASGGASAIRAFGGPFPQVRFCPTGGVSAINARDYLQLDNVACVGGSWVAPKNLVAAADWDAITSLARQANLLPPHLQAHQVDRAIEAD